MTDIELVIKIPEELYYIVQDKLDFNGDLDKQKVKALMLAIDNGVPLPKGHGTLKDTDAICEDIISALGIHDESYLLEAEKAIYKRIKNATAIIEADKAESEDKE